MKQKKQRQEADNQLLEALFSAENEWRQIQAIMDKSVEPTEGGWFQLKLAQAKYLFLLREARRRDVRAIQQH
ncbi:hypothetical protein GCM10028778_01160 [Barrientosiimonas marina]|uniref:YaaL family protein n=1 Tax=Lentibacillus kimchii TaxID=1542911 RepID=A0ABW2UWS2_9BACI